ncbi:MAG: hypothetical protein WBX02_14315 [Terriglobales bacterium]
MQLHTGQDRRKTPWLAVAIGALLSASFFLAITAAVAWNFYSIRTATKWLMWSRRYKSEVLAQPTSANGGFKHIDWDGWGMFAQNTEVYLVFDPTDSLSRAASSRQPGKFGGIPCEVNLVRRLESHWYAVQFYTSQDWDHCD